MAADWNVKKFCVDLQKVLEAKQMDEEDTEHVKNLIKRLQDDPTAFDQTKVYNWLMENPHPSKRLTISPDCKKPLRWYKSVHDRAGLLIDMLFGLRFSSQYN